jgi:hypothetical protein
LFLPEIFAGSSVYFFSQTFYLKKIAVKPRENTFFLIFTLHSPRSISCAPASFHHHKKYSLNVQRVYKPECQTTVDIDIIKTNDCYVRRRQWRSPAQGIQSIAACRYKRAQPLVKPNRFGITMFGVSRAALNQSSQRTDSLNASVSHVFSEQEVRIFKASNAIVVLDSFQKQSRCFSMCCRVDDKITFSPRVAS